MWLTKNCSHVSGKLPGTQTWNVPGLDLSPLPLSSLVPLSFHPSGDPPWTWDRCGAWVSLIRLHSTGLALFPRITSWISFLHCSFTNNEINTNNDVQMQMFCMCKAYTVKVKCPSFVNKKTNQSQSLAGPRYWPLRKISLSKCAISILLLN